jgi:hypothetical protein
MTKSQCLRKTEIRNSKAFFLGASLRLSAFASNSITSGATPTYETANNPKYFPIYFKTDEISRVSFKDAKDGNL